MYILSLIKLPKCKLSILIDNPLALDSKFAMVYIPKTMIVQSKIPCFGFQRSILVEYYENVIKEKTITMSELIIDSLTQLINSHGYHQAEIIFDAKLNQIPLTKLKENK